MTDIIIQKAPSAYQGSLQVGDREGNSNQKIDTANEANAAAANYCKQKSEINCQKFMEYLENQGYSLYAFRKQRTQKVVSLTSHGILFPEGRLPRGGANVVITGRRNANVAWGKGLTGLTVDPMKRSRELTFVFDGSGSMRNKFTGSKVNKFDYLKHAFFPVLDFFPPDIKLNLNIFGPDDTVRNSRPKLNFEVYGGSRQSIKQALDLKSGQLKGASYLWANLQFSVEKTGDGGLVFLYTDGASDTHPTKTGREEKDKKSRMTAIIEYIKKHKINIYIACGTSRAKKHMREFAARSKRVHLYTTVDKKSVEHFFEKKVKGAVLRPEAAYYKISISDLKGRLLGTEEVGNAPPLLAMKSQILMVKAGQVKFDNEGRIGIKNLTYTDQRGKTQGLDLSKFVPVGKAELVFNKVSLNIPPLPNVPLSKVISLVLDRSGSMRGNRLERLKAASQKFVSSLASVEFSLNEFKDAKALSSLFYRIDSDFGKFFTKKVKYRFRNIYPKMMISFLNRPLQLPFFYLFWRENANYRKINLPIEVKRLANSVSRIFNKKFRALLNTEQAKIANLNRKLLELSYDQIARENANYMEIGLPPEEVKNSANSVFHLFNKIFRALPSTEKAKIANLNRKLLELSYDQICPRKTAYQFGINFFPDAGLGEPDNKIELMPTADAKAIKKVINNATSDGRTPGWQNIMRSLAATPDYGSLVIFSDGSFNGGVSDRLIRTVLKVALAKRIKIYFIGLGSTFDKVKESRNPKDTTGFLKYITRRTTGDNRAFIHVDEIANMSAAFQRIRRQIEQSRLVVDPPKPTAVRIPVRKRKEKTSLILEIQLPSSGAAKTPAITPPVNTFKDSLVKGINLKVNKSYRNGTVASGSLISPVEIHGTNLPVGTRVFFDKQGRVRYIVLPKDTVIGIFSFKLKAGKKIKLDRSGKIKTAYPAEEINGIGETPSGNKFNIRLKAGGSLIKFSDFGRGKISGGVLAADVTIDGKMFKAGTWQEMHASKDDFDRIKIGTLAKTAVINGKTYSAGTEIWLSPSGQVIKAK